MSQFGSWERSDFSWVQNRSESIFAPSNSRRKVQNWWALVSANRKDERDI
jgi:hypothetical protein